MVQIIVSVVAFIVSAMFSGGRECSGALLQHQLLEAFCLWRREAERIPARVVGEHTDAVTTSLLEKV